MRPAQLIRVLDREFTSTAEGHHTPVMLWGPPGVGKSQMVAQIAARHGAPVIDIRPLKFIAPPVCTFTGRPWQPATINRNK